MIRKLFVSGLLALGICQFALGQNDYPVPYDQKENMIVYEEVLEVPNVTAGDLFKRAQNWLDSKYTNVNTKFYNKSFESKAMGLNLYIRAEEGNYSSEEYKFKMELLFKEGRFKYKIFKIHIDKGRYFGLERWLEPDYLEKEIAYQKLEVVNRRITQLTESLKEYMINPPVKVKEEDW